MAAAQDGAPSEEHINDEPLIPVPELRVVLLGGSWSQRMSVGNFILGDHYFKVPNFVGISRRVEKNKLTVINTLDLDSSAEDKLEEFLHEFKTISAPGPHVFLLLIEPKKFTEEDRNRMCRILQTFSDQSFEHSLIMILKPNKYSAYYVAPYVNKPALQELIKKCKCRCLEQKNLELKELLGQIGQIVKEKNLEHVSNGDVEETAASMLANDSKRLSKQVTTAAVAVNAATDGNKEMASGMSAILRHSFSVKEPNVTCLNLVLCGRREPVKTSAARAILGQTDLPSASNSSGCVRNQGEVCGRLVSVVELPALYGKAQQEVMEESFRCISLCEPEGVHAFILVLPVGPLTDEDKGELQTIQDTFSSRVNDFTMILFTTESDPTASPVVNFINKSKDIQELLQSCGGRYFVFNVKDRKQIPELMKMMDRAITDKKSPYFYTSETFLSSQIEKNIKHVEHITRLEAEIKKLKKIELDQGEEIDQSSSCLRIVLIGKTGCGKSSSANTILGRRVFEAKAASESVTKRCQKEQCVVEGRPVAVVDTPGLFDDSLSHEEVYDETLKCMSLLAPGPHVFLLVLQIGRITPEEKETLRLIKEGFGKGAEKFTIILFTNGDKLEHEEQTIEDYIGVNDYLKKLISDCGGRCHVFNNYDKKNQTQVSELIRKIDMMVKENNNRFYSNEMLQEAEAAILKKTEKILKEKEEEMKREKEELKRKYDEEMQEMKRTMEEQKEQLKQEAEQRLKEMKENIDKEQKQREKEQEERENEKRKRESEEINHRESLIKQLEILDKQIQSEKEAKTTVSRELENTRKERQKYKEAWEKECKERWDRQKEEEDKRKQEEKRKMRELEEQYKKERERYEERKKEEQIRREQEEKERKKLEEKLECVQKEYEEKAREEAVRSNEFQEKYKKEFEEQKEELKKQMKDKDEKYDLLKALAAHNEAEKRKQYQTEISNLVTCISKKKENLTKIKDLLTKHEQEIKEKKTEKEKEELQKNHEKQISELAEKLLKEPETTSSCCIL